MDAAQPANSERTVKGAIAQARQRKLRMRNATLAVVAALIAGLLLLIWWVRWSDYPSILRSAHKVEAHRWTNKTVLLTNNSSEITSWIAPGPWVRKKKPCPCMYDVEIIFYTPYGIYSAMCTDHSLIVARGRRDRPSRSKEFVPPPGFWTKYRELLSRAEASQPAP